MSKHGSFLTFFVVLSLTLSELCPMGWGREDPQEPCLLASRLIENTTLTLSISQPPSRDDCLFIANKLHDFNVSQVGEIVDTFITYPFFKTPIACINQNSLFLDSNALMALISQETLSPIEVQQLLLLLQNTCAEKGVRRLFSSCQQSSMLNDIFEEAGFILQASYLSFSDDYHIKTYYKDLSKESVSIIDIPHISLEFTNEKLVLESVDPQTPKKQISSVKNPFGLFLNEGENGGIKGGCIGYTKKNENALYSYAFIEILWIDESLRGKGMGKTLLSATDEFLKKKGVKFIQLCTHDFQAPGFYERRGYALTKVYPDLFTTLSGVNSSVFACTKSLHS